MRRAGARLVDFFLSKIVVFGSSNSAITTQTALSCRLVLFNTNQSFILVVAAASAVEGHALSTADTAPPTIAASTVRLFGGRATPLSKMYF
jgi:hypothetical protein